MPCYSPLKCWKDETGKPIFKAQAGAEEMALACGQCLGCRLDRSRMWAGRIVHEASLHEFEGGNSFITLTYRSQFESTLDELHNKLHIPDDWSLHHSHFQKFMKRFRKAIAPHKVKFYMCGEYGNVCKHNIPLDDTKCPACVVGRPHYHAIIFNFTFPDLEVYSQRDGITIYTSPFLEALWKFGFVTVGAVNYESAAYVARYCLKKITGPGADTHYRSIDLDGVESYIKPEYNSMSLGIGKGYFEKHKDDMFPSDEMCVQNRGVFKKVPRYYEKLFEVIDPLTLEEMKELRKQYAEEHPEEFEPGRLMQKYKVKQAQMQMLKRTVT